MGASVRPDPVADYLAAVKPTSAASNPVDDYLSSLKGAKPAGHDYHAEFASGALDKRMQGANARDAASLAEDPTEHDPGVAGSIADATQGMPGVGALQSAARSGVSKIPVVGRKIIGKPESYREAYQNIKGATDKVPMSAKIIGRMATGAPAMAALPGSGMLSGAVFGGADQALDANPDKGLGSRVVTGAAGAAAGGLFGKAGEVIGLLPRLIRAPSSGANIIARQAARGADANAGYAAALAEGQGKTGTSAAIAHWLKQPDIAQIQKDLLETRQFAGKAPDSPEVLDGIYKVLSDHQQQIERGLDAATPTRPNTGRFRSEDIGLAKQEGMDAMSGGTTMPGPMLSYRPTVANYAKASGDIKALETGQDALRHSLNKGVTTGKNIDATTKEAFTRWIQNPATTASNAKAASEGVMGATKEDFIKHPMKNILGGRAVGKAPGLLRATSASSQPLYDLLTKVGLLGANAAHQ